MKFIRRTTETDYIEDQIVSITIDGNTDTDIVENVPKTPDTALEIETDTGEVFVVLAYKRK